MENNLHSSFEHAKSMFEQGNFNTCNNEMLKLINSGYEVAACNYYIGLIYMNVKEYKEAIKAFSNSLAIDPKNINCLYSLGVTLEKQNNKEQALQYYYKALAINPNHTNSNTAVSRLKGDQSFHHQEHSNISGQAQSHSTAHSAWSNTAHAPEHQDSSTKHKQSIPNKTPANAKKNVTVITLYDELLASKDPDSQIAVEMINAVRIVSGRPRFSAFLGGILIRVLLVLFPIVMIGMANAGFFYMMGGMSELYTYMLPILLLATLILVYKLIKIKSTKITIADAFIEVKQGVFFRSEPLYYVHKTEHFDIHQNPINIMTGDGTFVFDVEVTQGNLKKVKIKGLGTMEEMRHYKNVLQNLRIQLRNTPVIKSGIYG